jgi:Ribbon-helix-helix protein, copG family.
LSEKKFRQLPVNNPLSERVYLRVDAPTKDVLDECAEKLGFTRSEVVRQGIYLVKEQIE